MKEKNRGTAIFFTLGILMVLSVTALSFVNYMSLERKASKNYSNKTAARLAAFAGFDRAIRGLITEMKEKPYTCMRDNPPLSLPPSNYTWHYRPLGTPLSNAIRDTRYSESEQVISYQFNQALWGGSFPYNARFSGAVGIESGNAIVGTYENWGDTYALRILDCSGQINLNSHYSDNLVRSNKTLKRIIKYLAEECGFNDTTIPSCETIASTLVVYPNVLTHRRWDSKDEIIKALQPLLPSIPSESILSSYRLFLDCITTESWIDPNTSVVNNIEYISIDPSICPNYATEERAPININTAPREVLVAILKNLQARPILWTTNVLRKPSSDGATTGGSISEDLELKYNPRRVDSVIDVRGLYINDTMARNIASTIIDYRLHHSSFKDWNDFSFFIDSQLVPPTLSPPDPGEWPNDMHPSGGNDPDLGNKIWSQAFYDMLRANFNPNTVDNCFNPNLSSYMHTVKADLFDENGEPAHSTEFCFCSWGRYEINSLGRITAFQGMEIASVEIKANVVLADIARQTTQRQFHSEIAGQLPYFHNTTSYPEITSLSWEPDQYVGQIEVSPLPFSPADFSVTYPCSDDQHPFLSDINSLRSIPLTKSDRFISMGWGPLPPRFMTSQSISSVRDRLDNMVNDGLFSSRTQTSSLSETRYFSIPAVPRTMGIWRGVNLQPGAHIPYYRGAMEFWVKLTEDSNAQIGAGLFSASLVNPNPKYYQDEFGINLPPNTWPYTEGVQFYIFKNTLGELRFSRIYFCLCWDRSTNSQIGTLLSTDADDYNQNGTRDPLNREDHGPILFAYPRQDLVTRLDWRPRTWHHVYVKWNDSITPNLNVWIDGNKATDTAVQIVSDRISGSITPPPCNDPGNPNPEYCLLNEYNPRDCLNIAGFFRPQWQDGGIFKFSQNVDFPANATISDIRIYSTNRDPSVVPAMRFPTEASFTHNFKINQKSQLAHLLWTAYPKRDCLSANATLWRGASKISLDNHPVDNTDALRLDVPERELAFSNDRLEYTTNFKDISGDTDESVRQSQRGSLDDITLILIRPRIIDITEIEK